MVRGMDSQYEWMTTAELVAELKALHSAVSVFVFDAEGTVRDVNASGAAMVGVERKALIGQPFHMCSVVRARTVFRSWSTRRRRAAAARIGSSPPNT